MAVAVGCAPTCWVEEEKKGLREKATEFHQIFSEVQRLGGDDDDLPHPLQDITDLELEEIRQLKHPPEPVRRVMECVYLILYADTPPGPAGLTWLTVVKALVQTNFLRNVRRFEISELAAKPFIVDCICREYFNRANVEMRLDRVRRASSAVVAFFGWTIALLAGVLPKWPVEQVAGAEPRQVVFELEAERRVLVKQEIERKEEEKREQARKEETKKEAKRLGEEEQEQKKQEEVERERQRQEEAAREKAEHEEVAQQAEEAAQQAEAARRAEEERKLRAVRVERARQEQVVQELEVAGYQKLCVWNLASNPDRRLLHADGSTISFPDDANANFCNVVETPAKLLVPSDATAKSCDARLGLCGGMRISGWNLRPAWTYYCGRRWAHTLAHKMQGVPGLHVDKKAVQSFARVVSGDVIGMLVDTQRRGVAFLRNSDLQGACLLDSTSKLLYVITHLDAAGDTVELHAHAPSHAPKAAFDAIDALFVGRGDA
mmetsp:Transcript_12685/g.40921  ORF Transcript_12685/g.40921 Transcript_12685/m.40921 type:complete len:490 (+) Transcript_12685:74-1543(+)